MFKDVGMWSALKWEITLGCNALKYNMTGPVRIGHKLTLLPTKLANFLPNLFRQINQQNKLTYTVTLLTNILFC